eukprot:749883-Hanusia_phi.AAC.10
MAVKISPLFGYSLPRRGGRMLTAFLGSTPADSQASRRPLISRPLKLRRIRQARKKILPRKSRSTFGEITSPKPDTALTSPSRSRTLPQPTKSSDAESKFSMPIDLATVIVKDVKKVMSELMKVFQDLKVRGQAPRLSVLRTCRLQRKALHLEQSEASGTKPAGDETSSEHKLLVASTRLSGDEVWARRRRGIMTVGADQLSRRL